jgi:hypothetical protein
MATNARRYLHLLAEPFWTLFGAYLVAAWAVTVTKHASSVYAYSAAWIVLLIMYFLAEGLQLTYADLRDKDEQQIRPEVLPALRRIRANESRFNEGREWFVLVLVICLTHLLHFYTLRRKGSATY